MRQVTGVDEAGCELLSAMHKAGARLVAEGVAMTALIEEITGKKPLNNTKRQPPRKKSFARSTFPNQERQ